MFAKLAKKYGASNPLEDLPSRPEPTSNPTHNTSVMIDEPSQFMESSNDARQIHSSAPTTTIQGMVPSTLPSLTSQGFGLPDSLSTTPFPSTPSPFGQVSNSFANSHRAEGGNNLLSNTLPSSTSTGMFRGKSARELLTEFYREKNPSKISDVDHVLLKYQVRKLSWSISNSDFV